jgi:drug/metabolite transporter (DMT)-like permease
VRFSNAELPPFLGAGLRFTFASIILLAVVLIMRLEFPTGRALTGTLIFGFLQYGISYALGYWSLLFIPAGLFQVILALVPLITFFVAILHGQEKFEWRILIGGLLALVGIVIIFRDQIIAQVPFFALVSIVLMAVCFAEASVLFKAFPRSHPVTTNAVAMAFGALILLISSRIFGEPAILPTRFSTWVALTYLVIFGSVIAFVLIFFVLKRWKASTAAYQLVIMPVVTILSAHFILGEPITSALLLGGLFILLGVYVGVFATERFLQRLIAGMTGEKSISE